MGCCGALHEIPADLDSKKFMLPAFALMLPAFALMRPSPCIEPMQASLAVRAVALRKKQQKGLRDLSRRLLGW